MPQPLSVVFPVLNEEANLPDALESVAWADEVFVVDSGSTDRTVEIAQAAGAKVVRFEYVPGGPKKKGWSLRNLPFTHEWALYLDGDERVTPELRVEIEAALAAPEHDGYYVDRDLIFLGRSLSSYRPDWNLRLFRHAKVEMEDLGLHDVPGTGDNEIHEHFLLDGSKGYLVHPIFHNDFRGIGPWIDRHNRYATWDAHLYRQWRSQPVGLSARTFRGMDPIERNRALRRLWTRLPGRPVLRFLVWVVLKRAYRDGRQGMTFAVLMAWYEFLIGLKLREQR